MVIIKQTYRSMQGRTGEAKGQAEEDGKEKLRGLVRRRSDQVAAADTHSCRGRGVELMHRQRNQDDSFRFSSALMKNIA